MGDELIGNAVITWLDEPLRGAPEGPLAGRTLLVKDLIDTAGVRTTYGSRIYAEHVPGRHATVVQRALDAGALVLGKASLPEFAWNVTGQNPWYGTVHNPARPGRTTGGSSSGNAAALASGLAELGIGTDTGCDPPPVGLLRRRGLSRAGAPFPWTASSRSARRSTPPARWRARSPTSRCSGRCSRGGRCPRRGSRA